MSGRLRARLLPALILATVLLLNIFARYRLRDVPFERDEGEHAYTARTMLAGHPPYKLAYGLKLPGTDAAYAVFMWLFGETASAIRVGLLIVNAATILLVAATGTRLFGLNGGVAAGAAYGLLALSQNVVGIIVHATHFVAFFSMLGTLILLKQDKRPAWMFCAGLGYGMTILMKQPGAVFGVFGGLYLVWFLRRSRVEFVAAGRTMGAFCVGLGLPYGMLCLVLWRAGVFERFWLWTFTLSRAYMTQHKEVFHTYLIDALRHLPGPNLGLWMMAGVGLALAVHCHSTRVQGCLTAAMLVLAAFAVAAGGYIPNYFIMLFPPLALLVGAFVAATESLLGNTLAKHRSLLMKLPLLAVVSACLCSAALQGDYLFSMSGFEFSRSSYGLNPFPEAIQIAEYIRANSSPNDTVAVMGSEAEIYFYADRPAATGYLFAYSLMESHQYAAALQGDMIGEIEGARPKFIVDVLIASSWMATAESSTGILDWLASYTQEHYDVVGIIELPGMGPAQYRWGPKAATYRPGSQAYIAVYRRR